MARQVEGENPPLRGGEAPLQRPPHGRPAVEAVQQHDGPRRAAGFAALFDGKQAR